MFLVAKHYQTLYAVCILDMFNLSGLISIRSMISKLVSKQNTGKAFAVLAVVESLVEGLSAEYYWIYTATSNGIFFLNSILIFREIDLILLWKVEPEWHSGFVYCLNMLVVLIVILPFSFCLMKKLRRVEEFHFQKESTVNFETAENTIKNMANTNM